MATSPHTKLLFVSSALLIAVSAGLLISNLLLFQQPREFKISLSERGEGGYVTAVLNCSFPNVPDKVPVLRVVRHNYTEDEAIAIARNIFNINGELEVIYRPTPTDLLDIFLLPIEVTNQKEVLYLFYEGSIEYWIHYDSFIKPSLPSPEQAKETADNLLAKLETLRSPSLQIAYQSVEPGEWYAPGPENAWVVHLNVNYELKYANMPIIGGSDVVVSIGDEGRIVEFRGGWRNVEPGDDVSITVTPEQALENMGPNLRLGGHIPKELIINNIELGYWAEAVDNRQDTLLPIYVFEGTMITENDEKLPWHTSVPTTTPS